MGFKTAHAHAHAHVYAHGYVSEILLRPSGLPTRSMTSPDSSSKSGPGTWLIRSVCWSR